MPLKDKQFEDELIEFEIKAKKSINDFTRKHWKNICISLTLPEYFMEKYKDQLDWYYVSAIQPLTEQFIIKYQDKVHWKNISQFQRLSKPFINKYWPKLDLHTVSQYQSMSIQFIMKHKDEVSWYHILKHRKLSHKNLVLLIGIGQKFNNDTKHRFRQQLKGEFDSGFELQLTSELNNANSK